MTGSEWVVEAHGCDPVRLADLDAMRALFGAMVLELRLNPVGDALWHKFPGPGGITGMLLLAESHLTVHTFPEHESLCLNLFCCTPREAWAWDTRLRALVGAQRVQVRTLRRAYARPPAPPPAPRATVRERTPDAQASHAPTIAEFVASIAEIAT